MLLYDVYVASNANDQFDWVGQAQAHSAVEACAVFNAYERTCEPDERYLVRRGLTIWRFIYMPDESYGGGDPSDLIPLLHKMS